jgi:hypothetical protein
MEKNRQIRPAGPFSPKKKMMTTPDSRPTALWRLCLKPYRLFGSATVSVAAVGVPPTELVRPLHAPFSEQNTPIFKDWGFGSAAQQPPP